MKHNLSLGGLDENNLDYTIIPSSKKNSSNAFLKAVRWHHAWTYSCKSAPLGALLFFFLK